ncbi:TG isoform 2, partial [Pan troglodytes]
SAGASALLRSGPYVPQCDAFGSWEPVQCHAGTGHCWCVDEKGGFIPASLTARSLQIPQCPTTCEKSRTSGLLSSWKQARSQENPSPRDLFVPACLEARGVRCHSTRRRWLVEQSCVRQPRAPQGLPSSSANCCAARAPGACFHQGH